MCAGFLLAVGATGAGCGGGGRGDCNPSSCAGCCDSEGVCQAGFLDAACGTGGAACAVCTSPMFCGNGACFSPGGGGGGGGSGDGGSGGDAGTDRDAGTGGDGGTSSDGGTDRDGGTGLDGGSNREAAVCARLKGDRADRSEGTWTGNVSTCTPGDNPQNRANALKIMNLYRFIADLPPVTTDPTRDARAQACALMMHANGQLSHSPPSSWNCYSQDGAQGAASSNISPTPGVAGVDLYMIDPGNATTLGHRRWILSPKIGPVGLGTTSSYSCMWVIGGSGSVQRTYVAWPPEGPFPFAAFTASPLGSSLNDTGWSIQSDSINLNNAQVTVTLDDRTLPVTTTALQQGFGNTHAIRFNPQGWLPQAGQSYRVNVSNVTAPFSYVVDVVACP